ncbi:glycoside hydrolase family 43 protein [Cohnella herbarum]|uniref:Glycoside hydrolase family 43 protein n=1 Tax=Cohnella herbarum TaxID=2728023 RepID=A0A7Z2VL24_9BACL|nr:glycoside hydrolase family 43 protein [Cohnella herbarum]QJD85006.1 glycoside hydrolase family 43 protein [Cohnella herbarum]
MSSIVGQYVNPVIPGFYPDPSICRVGTDYYLVTSSFQYFPGVPIFHSRDLVHWEQIGHCLNRESQLDLERCRSSMGIYAPTLRFHQGRFFMVTTNMNSRRNFYVWSETPDGPWSDPIWLDWSGIDPSLFFDDDGRVYLSGTNELGTNEPHGIYQAEINIETGQLLTERRLIWNGTGGQAPEGPHMYRVHGKYYLMIAEGGTEYGHMVTIARADSPYGPFESNPGNPILSHRSTNHPIQATGHADLVQLEDGSWWAVFLGIRPVSVPFVGRHHHLGRETFLAPVTWSAEGWPVIGDGGKVTEKLPVGAEASLIDKNEFEGNQLQLCWNFLRNPQAGEWSLEERPGWLTLHGSATTLNDIGSPAFVGRRQQHFNCSVSTLLSFNPVREGEEAGLTVYMNERFHYEIALTYNSDTGRKVILRRRIGSLWKVEFEAAVEDSDVILGLEADPSTYSFFYAEPNGERMPFGTAECSLLSTEVAGGFTGVYIGLYATGNGRHCTVPAYFDWFDYKSH